MNKTADFNAAGNKQFNKADGISITYYTDPLCCWSWAFEPHWRRLLFLGGNDIQFRYCMGGLLPSWNNYHDSSNNVSRPIQMGPVWMHAQQVSGRPMRNDIWMRDPPASSYPACMAVKAAGMQSSLAEDQMLLLLREAVMNEGLNTASKEVLYSCGVQLAELNSGFDIKTFRADLVAEKTIDAFKKDLQEAGHLKINRFPTLVIKNSQGRAILLRGYRDYDGLVRAMESIIVAG